MKTIITMISVLCSNLLYAQAPNPTPINPNETLLPDNFLVYIHETHISRMPEPGYLEKQLPTINLFKGNPGCYLACYSHNPSAGIFPTGENTYLMGQVRVAGKYQGNTCEPMNFSGQDIRTLATFKALCALQIQNCKENQCWADGETGLWFAYA